MNDILKVEMIEGRFRVIVQFEGWLPYGLRLEMRAADMLLDACPIPKHEAKGDEAYARWYDIELDRLLAPEGIRFVLLRRKKVLAEFKAPIVVSNRKERPIIVSNRRSEGTRLQGWVVPKPSDKLRLSLFVNGKYRETVAPNSVRPDILKMYPETKSMKNGFGLGIPPACFDGKPHTLVVIEETHMKLAENCPLTLTATELRDGLTRRADALLRELGGAAYKSGS